MKTVLACIVLIALTACSVDPQLTQDQARTISQKCLDIKMLPVIRYYAFYHNRIASVECIPSEAK